MLNNSRSVEQLRRPASQSSLNDSASQTRIQNESGLNAYQSGAKTVNDKARLLQNQTVRSGSYDMQNAYLHTEPNHYENSTEKGNIRSNIQIKDNLSIDTEAQVRASIRANLVRSHNELFYVNPKVDHNYHIRGTLIVKKN